ncbi:hypothetical protein OF846_005049 [Rhodotorula toruloides]|nr:hypothetical protein OF846_005049 [Rhodotorula toruloides]
MVARMARRLPLELELAIVRLAIPPLISIRRLGERVEMCKALSLVCRQWTQLAQEELRQHVTFSLYEVPPDNHLSRWDEDRVSRRKLSLEEKGWDTNEDDLVEHAEVTEMVLPCFEKGSLEKMWVVFNDYCMPEWYCRGDIKRLHITSHGRHRRDVCPWMGGPPWGLEYLSVTGIDAGDLSQHRMSSLQALVLNDVSASDWTIQALSGHPALTILACVHRFLSFDHFISNLPRSLQHFAYYPIDADSEHNMDMAECTTFDLPPNLRSFTFVSSAPERYHCLTAIEIGEACKRVGATFVHVAGQGAKDWEAEEWAYSLMA